MATRRSYGYGQESLMQPSSMMTPKAQSDEAAYAQPQESSETFRRRVAPIVGMPEQRPSMIQELLAMLNGAQ